MIKMIWCEDSEHGIGVNNKMPWCIPEEMRHFVLTTKGHTVVMGRKTFESIGSKPLPKRRNIVLTKNIDLQIPGVEVCNDFNKIIELGRNEDLFIIGGASIYKQFAPYAQQLIVSKLPNIYNCTEFADIDYTNFEEVNVEDNKLFVVHYYERKK